MKAAMTRRPLYRSTYSELRHALHEKCERLQPQPDLVGAPYVSLPSRMKAVVEVAKR